MDNPQATLNVSEAELGWLGGVIDGEGTVAFTVYYHPNPMNPIRVKPQIIVAGTDKDLIEHTAGIIGRLGVGVHVKTDYRTPGIPTGITRNTPKLRPCHFVTVAGMKRNVKFLPIIIPYLVSIKRQKATMMLRYMTRRLEKTAVSGRWAAYDAEDLTTMLEIMRFAAIHNGKGPKSKNIGVIEGVLRDITQSEPALPLLLDDVVRTSAKADESQRRGGSAPRKFGGVSKLEA